MSENITNTIFIRANFHFFLTINVGDNMYVSSRVFLRSELNEMQGRVEPDEADLSARVARHALQLLLY